MPSFRALPTVCETIHSCFLTPHNPFIHSLLVTLGNHAVHDVQTYNWACPVGPSADVRDGPQDGTLAAVSRDSAGSDRDQGLEFVLLWRCSDSTNKKF